jgi:predicted peroxiredoxin
MVGVKIEIKMILFSLVWVLIATNPGIAMDQNSQKGKLKILFHVKTSLDVDDAQICVVPNVAWAAIHKGHDVTLLFDGSAVTSVKKGGFFDQTKTDIDRAKLPERERKALSQQFNYSLEQIPHNYGEYLHFIKKLGAKIYINKTMMLLYQIEPDQIDSSLEPIGLNEMLDIMTNSDFYSAY